MRNKGFGQVDFNDEEFRAIEVWSLLMQRAKLVQRIDKIDRRIAEYIDPPKEETN